MIVTEMMDGIPVDKSIRKIQRDEKLLISIPDPEPLKIWSNYDPLSAIHVSMDHVRKPFSTPQGVFESDYIHIEYTSLTNGRQPFYHRNTDVDEIAYHVTGTRQVITEIGTVDLAPGDYSRIPVGVSHDNHAINDVHFIFYIPQGVVENIPSYKSSEYLIPPFEGWSPKPAIEFITERLGAVGSDNAVYYTDEQMLLENAKTDPLRMPVLRASGLEGVEWLYKSENIWLGSTKLTHAQGTIYTRHRMATEVQIQVTGKRWLISQRGTLEIEPGDCVSIPLGCAFTSVTQEESVYITVLMRYPAEAKKTYTKTAERTTEDLLGKIRGQVMQNGGQNGHHHNGT